MYIYIYMCVCVCVFDCSNLDNLFNKYNLIDPFV